METYVGGFDSRGYVRHVWSFLVGVERMNEILDQDRYEPRLYRHLPTIEKSHSRDLVGDVIIAQHALFLQPELNDSN
jgi:hypothetical protein